MNERRRYRALRHEARLDEERKILRERKVGRFVMDAASGLFGGATGVLIAEVGSKLITGDLLMDPGMAVVATLAVGVTSGAVGVRREFGDQS